MKIFFSAPFTKCFDFDSGEYKDPDYPRFLARVAEGLEHAGHDVYLAQRDDDWGQSLGSPEEDTKKDFYRLRDWCECVLCYTNDLSSVGVCIELGWASAFRKRIILAQAAHRRVPPYVWGLQHLTDLTVFTFSDAAGLLGAFEEKLD